PVPLLGRDLLTKLRARIHFEEGGVKISDGEGNPLHVLTMRLEDEYRIYQPRRIEGITQEIMEWVEKIPEVWAETAGVGRAAHRAPIIVELKPGVRPVRVRQYPMTKEAKTGITPHINRLIELGILKRCRSPWNTPLLPVRKPGGNDYRPVQDLREINARVEDIHPTVPNPYTLLSTLPPSMGWYTVLDLKDAFFSLMLAEKSQEIFAFEWEDLQKGIAGQLTWTRLPQGFKNSPTLFNEALSEDLQSYRNKHPELTLLQYVDDILIAGMTEEDCKKGTEDLLQELVQLGYRVSAKKAQICKKEVVYLGYKLSQG
uniref:ribonuclease H n=1 Tax=Nothoprocta perdicaria TaxID=30464 RepID=A0A8C6YUY5_NOTPE